MQYGLLQPPADIIIIEKVMGLSLYGADDWVVCWARRYRLLSRAERPAVTHTSMRKVWRQNESLVLKENKQVLFRIKIIWQKNSLRRFILT